MLPLTLNVNVLPLKVATVTVSAYMLTVTFATVLTVANAKLSVYVLPELQLNKANISDTEAPFLDLHLSVANGFISSKIYDKRDDFDFDIVNFPFLDGDVPRRASYGVYISQLIRFA